MYTKLISMSSSHYMTQQLRFPSYPSGTFLLTFTYLFIVTSKVAPSTANQFAGVPQSNATGDGTAQPTRPVWGEEKPDWLRSDTERNSSMLIIMSDDGDDEADVGESFRDYQRLFGVTMERSVDFLRGGGE